MGGGEGFENKAATQFDVEKTGLDSGTPDTGVAHGYLESGTVFTARDGYTFEFSNPPGPGAQFSEFLSDMLHAFASGVGMPYEQLTWNYKDVNYSSGRLGLLEFRRCVEQFQYQVMVHQFCRPVWRRWIKDAVISGALAKPSGKPGDTWADLYAVEWRPPVWDWVDPLKDVQAKIMEMDAGITSRTAIIRERGYTAEQVDATNAADHEREKRLGITIYTPQRKVAGNEPAGDGAGSHPQEEEEETTP